MARGRKAQAVAGAPAAEAAPELNLAHDPAAWIDRNILVNELGKPFALAPYQRRVLAAMFVFDESGKVWIDEAVWSEIKKSGKTTMAALLGLWWGDTQEAPNEIVVVANDLEQSTSRAFATMVQLIKRNPRDRDDRPGIGSRARRRTSTEISFKSGTVVKAIASEYAGAAGSNHGLTLWDEIWAGTTEPYRRLWDELTPVPTRLNSIRLVFSYAGFEGESKTLRDLYLAGVDTDEHPEGRGERIDPALPIYRSKEGAGLNSIAYWNHEPVQPWQTAGWLARQKQDHIAKGRVSTWLRLFENRWVTGESAFITAALWDAITDPDLVPAAPTKTGGPVYVGLDVGIKNDTSGIAAVQLRKEPDGTSRWHLVAHKIMKPAPGIPVDHRDIAQYLRWLCRSFSVRRIGADPSQALEMIANLRREHLPTEEVPQTAASVDEMGVTLITAIQSRALVVYPDAELRQQALNVVAVEKPDGMMRMDKAKSGRKIDAIVALAMALRMSAAVKPGGGTFAGYTYDGPSRYRGTAPHLTYEADPFRQCLGCDAVLPLEQYGTGFFIWLPYHDTDGRSTLCPTCVTNKVRPKPPEQDLGPHGDGTWRLHLRERGPDGRVVASQVFTNPRDPVIKYWVENFEARCQGGRWVDRHDFQEEPAP